jgi:hypothetical protein
MSSGNFRLKIDCKHKKQANWTVNVNVEAIVIKFWFHLDMHVFVH